MKNNELITLRDYKKEDEDLIYSTFLLGVYHGESWFSKIQKPIFMHNYRLFLTKLLVYDNTKVKIACLKEDADIILGYAIMSRAEDTLHWVFVKSAWRNIGIAKGLVPETIKTVTHLSSQGEKIMNKRGGLTFNPFMI